MHTTLIPRNPQTRKEPGGNFHFFPLLQFLSGMQAAVPGWPFFWAQPASTGSAIISKHN